MDKVKIGLMAAIAFAYVVMGGFVISKQWFLVRLEKWPSIYLGIVLIAYGLFRSYRAYQILKKGSQ